MNNGWSAGQYRIFRVLFGLYLVIHFFQLLPWCSEIFSHQGMISNHHLSPLIHLFPNLLALNDSPLMVMMITLIGLAAACFFMIGKWDRIAAGVLWYILACFLGRNPLIANPSLPFVGWLLLAHLFVPKNKGITPGIFFAGWVVMSVAYTYSGIMKLTSPSWLDGSALAYLLHNPLIRCNALRDLLMSFPAGLLQLLTWGALALEVSFAFLALFKKLRPLIWTAMLMMHVGILCLINFADLTWGMIILHLFTFDPGWIKPRPIQDRLVVFYDGTCGFCHAFVRFVLSENVKRAPYRFAPLESYFPPDAIPNSLVVQDGEHMLYRSEAVFRVLVSLGGIWKLLALLGSLVPLRLCNSIYNGIARIRHRIFTKPKSNCPILSPEMREFFL